MKDLVNYLVFYTYTKKKNKLFKRNRLYNGKKEIYFEKEIISIEDLVNLEDTIKTLSIGEEDEIKDIYITNFIKVCLDK